MESHDNDTASNVMATAGQGLTLLAESVGMLLPRLDTIMKKINVLSTVANLAAENRNRSNDQRLREAVSASQVEQRLADIAEFTQDARTFNAAAMELHRQLRSLVGDAALLRQRGLDMLDDTESAVRQMEQAYGVTTDTYRDLDILEEEQKPRDSRH